jgi:hypothetical protein
MDRLASAMNPYCFGLKRLRDGDVVCSADRQCPITLQTARSATDVPARE